MEKILRSITRNVSDTADIDVEVSIAISEDDDFFDIVNVEVNSHNDIAISLDPYDRGY